MELPQTLEVIEEIIDTNLECEAKVPTILSVEIPLKRGRGRPRKVIGTSEEVRKLISNNPLSVIQKSKLRTRHHEI